MKHQNKKSQITLLILIGLVIVVMFVFFIYLAMSATKNQAELNIQKSQQGKATVRQVEEFVRQCVVKVARDGLDKLGKNGLRIDMDNGLYDFSNANNYVLDDSGNKVAYGIRGGQQKESPLFGNSVLPPLDNSGSSIRNHLELYIDKNIKKCTNFGTPSDQFKKQGFDISYTGNAKSFVNFADSFVNVKLDMPISVKNTVNGYTTKFAEFTDRVNVKFKKMYLRITSHYISEDTTKAGFDIRTPPASVDGFNLKVEQSRNIQDDIIILSESNKYSMQFARQNRAPVLGSVSASPGQEITEGDKVEFFLTANDPDEDEYSYGYTSNQDISSKGASLAGSQFTWQTKDGDSGRYEVYFYVKDNHGLSSLSKSSTITVKQKPIVNQ